MAKGALDVRDLFPTKKQQQHVEFLRRRIRSLEGQNERLFYRLEDVRETAREIGAAIVAAKPFPRHRYKERKKSGTPITPFLKLSDWHIGEVVKRDETEGFNKFNHKIAQARIFGIVDSFLRYVEVQRYAYQIPELVVSCEGDFISGDIHRELSVTNEWPVPVQTANAGLLLSEVIARLAPHFDKVRILEVGGDNHGRLTRKPQFKQKAMNNMNFAVYEIVNAHMARHKNVVIERPASAKYLASVAGWKVLIEHGDGFQGWMGIPFYGMERTWGREARKRMRKPKRAFDFWSIGHWHVPGVLWNRVLMNGSLSGTTEFDHLQGREAGPAQVAIFFHPEHGLFNWTAFGSKA
jgi:hypothetical protein